MNKIYSRKGQALNCLWLIMCPWCYNDFIYVGLDFSHLLHTRTQSYVAKFSVRLGRLGTRDEVATGWYNPVGNHQKLESIFKGPYLRFSGLKRSFSKIPKPKANNLIFVTMVQVHRMTCYTRCNLRCALLPLSRQQRCRDSSIEG